MRKLLVLSLLVSILPWQVTQANACESGQASGISINATTKEVTTVCFDIVAPTQAILEAEARAKIQETLSKQANSTPVTVVAEQKVSVTTLSKPQPIPPVVLQVNVATQEVTQRSLNELESARWQKEQVVTKAMEEAQAIANTNTEPGINYCVDWESVDDITGTNCSYEPVPVAEEEVNYQYDFLYDLFNFNWFEMLLAWLK